MTDQEILAGIQNDARFGSDSGLGDIFDDIGSGIENTWKSLIGTATDEAGKTVEKGIKEAFGNEEKQTPYDEMSQLTTLPQQTTTPPTEKTFIQKIPPVVVGAGTTAVVKYVGKFGWITSITAGVAAGAAKHFLIDKKQGV